MFPPGLSAINQLESEFRPLFVSARRSVEDAVIAALRPNEEGARRTLLRELRLDFQNIHQTIHAVHASLEEPFDRAARAARTMLDPMVALVKIFVQEDPEKQQSRRVMLFSSTACTYKCIPWFLLLCHVMCFLRKVDSSRRKC